jgi:hypothetical protein
MNDADVVTNLRTATEVVERLVQERGWEQNRAEQWRAEAAREEKARRNLEQTVKDLYATIANQERQLAESPFAPADVTLAELQGELDRAKAAIPCEACGEVGEEVHEVPDAWGAWLCVDSKACNARTAAGATGMIAAQAREMDALRKMLADRDAQIASQQATIDSLGKENQRMVAQLVTAGNDFRADGLAYKDALARIVRLADELARRPSERVVRNLVQENARLRQANHPLTDAAWKVVQAAQAWRSTSTTLTVMDRRDRLGQLIAALNALDEEEAEQADATAEAPF